MVKSPKTGRELEGVRIYKGPPWLARLIHGYLGTRSDDDSDSGR